MNTMIKELDIDFKEIEENIYKSACKVARNYTKEILEKYDNYLMERRDTSYYRNKGFRTTTIKTKYGEVTYNRRIYEVTREDGLHEYVFLLDENLKIQKVGLISINVAEQIVSSITELSYRETSKVISNNTDQTISPMGVWNIIQSLGESVCDDEKELVKQYKKGLVQGENETKVLFEEADGVYVRLQRELKDKAEIKVGIAYDGWKKTAKDRYSLSNKVVVAGFSSTKEFQEYREATIASEYNLDEVELRIMNADGAQWIQNICDEETIFQLDPFHRNKSIKENIQYPQARKRIHELLQLNDLDGLFEYLEIYKNSLSDDEEIDKAERLIKYFKNNKAGLIAYKDRDIELPSNSTNLEYKNMGTMENHIWSVIAKRMKHRHCCWSINGGNNLAKILAKKGSGKLNEVASKLKSKGFECKIVEKIENDILTAGQVRQKVGKGYKYPKTGRIPYLQASLKGNAHQMWSNIAGLNI